MSVFSGVFTDVKPGSEVFLFSDPPAERDAERRVEDGKENREDAAVKAKRKRKKKHKEKLKIGEEVIPLRVLSK